MVPCACFPVSMRIIVFKIRSRIKKQEPEYDCHVMIITAD